MGSQYREEGRGGGGLSGGPKEGKFKGVGGAQGGRRRGKRYSKVYFDYSINLLIYDQGLKEREKGGLFGKV